MPRAGSSVLYPTMPCAPGADPVSSDDSAAAVVDGATVRAVCFFGIACARWRACEAWARSWIAPRPSTRKSTAERAFGNQLASPVKESSICRATPTRSLACSGPTGRILDIRASLAHVALRARNSSFQERGTDGASEGSDPARRGAHRGDRARERDAGLVPRIRVLRHLLPSSARRAGRPQARAAAHPLPDGGDGP